MAATETWKDRQGLKATLLKGLNDKLRINHPSSKQWMSSLDEFFFKAVTE